jgi:hypothetical protein
MISDEFDARTMANIEVALERMCQRFPRELATHDARKQVAAALLRSAQGGHKNLGPLTAVAERAAEQIVGCPR